MRQYYFSFSGREEGLAVKLPFLVCFPPLFDASQRKEITDFLKRYKQNTTIKQQDYTAFHTQLKPSGIPSSLLCFYSKCSANHL